jgi:hypothetical protein
VRGLRLALRLLLASFVIAFAGYLYLAYAPAGDTADHPFNNDRNAVWLEHRWLEKAHPPEEMEVLLQSLDRHGIAYVFPHLIPFNGAGRLPLHSREQMRSFLSVARRVAPRMKVLPWVGGLRVGYNRQFPGAVDLADIGQRQRIVAECRGLMDEGFDGVHLNIEPVPDGDADFLALLRALRSAIGGGILSLSAQRPGPLRIPAAPNFLWTPDYYLRVAAEADQLVVMTYDTALPTPSLYRRYLAYAASSMTANLARAGRARLLIGIPTYDGRGRMHRGDVENPENALTGLVAGLRGVQEDGTFEGVALYAEWTTDDAEWATYERLWRNAR